MGYLLTMYQQFYSSPEMGANMWLTLFIGHWLGEPFGGTVVNYKLAASFILALTAVLAYLGLSIELGHRWSLAVSLFITFLFVSRSGEWVGYNNLTAFFYVFGGVTLFFGLRDERRLLVLLAGGILGANIFIRFPNILGFGLALTIVLHGVLHRWRASKNIHWFSIFLIGYAAGVVAVLLLMRAHGHEDYYIEGVKYIFEMAFDTRSHHAGSLLINIFIRDKFYALILSTIVFFFGIVILRLLIARPFHSQIAGILAAAVILAFAFHFTESWKWALTGIIYFGLIWIAWQQRRDRPALVTLAFICLTILVIAPLGSNNGIRNAIYGYWLALPLCLAWLWQRSKCALPALPYLTDSGGGRLAALTLGLSITGYGLFTAWTYAYRDSPNRFDLTHKIDHPLLAGTHTTEARAKVVGELLTELNRYVRAGDSLLAFPSLGALHYLTATKPMLNNPWPNLDSAPRLEAKLAKARTLGRLPVIVRSRGNTRSFGWPLDSAMKDSPFEESSMRILNEFVEHGSYRLKWRNSFFEILVPDS